MSSYSMADILAIERGSDRIDEAKTLIKRVMNSVVGMISPRAYQGHEILFVRDGIDGEESWKCKLRETNDDYYEWSLEYSTKHGCSGRIDIFERGLQYRFYGPESWRLSYDYLYIEQALPAIVDALVKQVDELRPLIKYYIDAGR